MDLFREFSKSASDFINRLVRPGVDFINLPYFHPDPQPGGRLPSWVKDPGPDVVDKALYWTNHYKKDNDPNSPIYDDHGTMYAWGGGNIHGPHTPPPGSMYSDSTGGAKAHDDDAVVGFDCSHLVEYAVWNATGGRVDLEPASQKQYGETKSWYHPSMADLKPGDIIFAEPDKDDLPAHVAIYSGRDQNGLQTFVEAPDSGHYVHQAHVSDKDFDSEFAGFNAARVPVLATGGGVASATNELSSLRDVGSTTWAMPEFLAEVKNAASANSGGVPKNIDRRIDLRISNPAGYGRACCAKSDSSRMLAFGRV